MRMTTTTVSFRKIEAAHRKDRVTDACAPRSGSVSARDRSGSGLVHSGGSNHADLQLGRLPQESRHALKMSRPIDTTISDYAAVVGIDSAQGAPVIVGGQAANAWALCAEQSKALLIR